MTHDTAGHFEKEDTKLREHLQIGVTMMKQWIKRVAVLGCAVSVLSAAPSRASAQTHDVQLSHQHSQDLSEEGAAIQTLVTLKLHKRELRKLVTNTRTAHDHPDLAEYYRSEAKRLRAEADRYQEFARASGDTIPLDAPNHFNIGRTARFDHIVATDYLRRAQNANVLAALHRQAAQRDGCFKCHRLNGQGGEVGPDLTMEGTRGRSDTWLIGHFKNPQARSPGSVMPVFDDLTDRQLQVLTAFLQSETGK